MNIINFVVAHWETILFFVTVSMGAIALYRREGIAALKNMLFSLVVEAEREYGAGTGELKKSAVVSCIYERLPKSVTLLITRSTIERLLETALAYAQKKWNENVYLRDYIKGEPPTPSVVNK